MKKLLLPLICITIFVIWISRVFFNSEIPYTHDGENHLARFANYEIAVREKQIPPRFAPNLVNHYGYPVFNYNYPLANIVSLPFSALKIHYETTYKIIVFLSLLAAGFGAYFFSGKFTNKQSFKLLGVVFYLSSPYVFNTVIFRGTIGEIMVYGFTPWLLMSIWLIKEKNYIKKLAFIVTTLLWGAFFLSHNVSVLLCIPLTLFLALFIFRKRTVAYLNLAITWLSAVCLSLWFWLPALMEKNQIILDSSGNNQSLFTHFPRISQLLFAPITFGYSIPGSVDTLSFSLGVIQLLVILLALITFFKNKRTAQTSSIKPWLLLTILFIFFQTMMSAPIWNAISIMRFVQFPWRLAIFLPIVLVPLYIHLLTIVKKPLFLVLTVGIVLQAIYLWNIPAVDLFHKEKIDYVMFAQTTTTQNENMPTTFTYTAIGDWEPTVKIISGSGSVKVISWSGSSRTYELTLQEKSTLVEPTMYFLGWETTANNTKVAYTDTPEIAGRIAYELEAGSYLIKTRFTEHTPARIIGDTVSLLAMFSLVVYSIYIYTSSRK